MRAPRRENKQTNPDEPETGACYYGADSNNFPLKRGLILHGGIRAAAVTAEHGLYFDTEWPITFEASDDGKSQTIIFQLTDDDEQRAKIARADDPPGNPVTPGPFSVGPFAQPKEINVEGWDVIEPMSLYPTTNCIFTARITLRAGEGTLLTLTLTLTLSPSPSPSPNPSSNPDPNPYPDSNRICAVQDVGREPHGEGRARRGLVPPNLPDHHEVQDHLAAAHALEA